jgi:hypothetical protein
MDMQHQKKKPDKPHRHALANFIDQVISAATVGPDIKTKHSAIRCWKKPNHRRCTGRIIVGIIATGEIEWKCPECGCTGTISNWKGIWPDLSELRKDDPPPYYEIIFLPQDFDYLVKCLAQNPEYDDIVYAAVWDGENSILRSNVSEIKELSLLLSELFKTELNPQKRRTLRWISQMLENIDGHRSAN